MTTFKVICHSISQQLLFIQFHTHSTKQERWSVSIVVTCMRSVASFTMAAHVAG